MQVFKYASMQVCKSASMQYAHIFKYVSMQVCMYVSEQVFKYAHICKYESMQVYASMQVCKYESMRVCKYTQDKFMKALGEVSSLQDLNSQTLFVGAIML